MTIRTKLFQGLLLAALHLDTACQGARADSREEPDHLAQIPEPISGDPVTPNPGDETEVKDPFKPYGIGPPEAAIPREQLTPAEQAAADRARNLDGTALDKYRGAVLQRSASVTGEVAARRLGVDNLTSIGVVP